MAEKKYSSNIVNGPLVESDETGFTGMAIRSENDEYKAGISIKYQCINAPGYSCLEPETNDYHMIIAFIGGDPANIEDFGAEISICLGEEKEEHVISSPGVISIPAGLLHFPLKVTKCDKPIVMLEILNKTEK